MPYTTTTLADLQALMVQRWDQAVFWTPEEARLALNESLREWNLLTGRWRQRITLPSLGPEISLDGLLMTYGMRIALDSGPPLIPSSLAEFDLGRPSWRLETTASGGDVPTVPTLWAPISLTRIAIWPASQGSYHQQVLADGATAFWPLNEWSGSGVANDYGPDNFHYGTLGGGVTAGVTPGPLATGDTAMTFDGTTGRIDINSAQGPLALPAALTLEAWVYGIVPQPTYFLPILSTQFAGATGDPVLFGVTGGTDPLGITSFVTRGSGGAFVGGIPVGDGAWHHLAAVFDPQGDGSLRLYTDGAGRSSFHSPVQPSEGDAALGYDPGYGTYWPGGLAQVAVYPRALSDIEIAAHYRLRTLTLATTPQPPGLVIDGVLATPLLVNPWDSVDLGEETIDVVVDMALHVAAFKEAATRWRATRPYFDTFLRAAAEENSLLKTHQAYRRWAGLDRRRDLQPSTGAPTQLSGVASQFSSHNAQAGQTTSGNS